MKKIGIITWHNHRNFGGSLQSYALKTVLQNKYDFDVEIINYDGSKRSFIDKQKKTIKSIMYFLLKNTLLFGKTRLIGPFDYFEKKYLKTGKHLNSYNDLISHSKKFDTIICGSDQIWAPNVFNSVYMLDFAATNVNKVSYAASIGLNRIPKELASQYRNLLKDFFAISVREEKGKELLKNTCNIDAEVVLDPTLLLNVEDYELLEAKTKIEKPYIFCYFLNENNNYESEIVKYANENNYIIIGISKKKSDSKWMVFLENQGPGEFLSLIRNAECVFTDSYHGSIFSMIYRKKFYVIERFDMEDPLNQNSRIYQLDKWFGISKCIVKSQDLSFKDDPIDYIAVEEKLSYAREISFSFLDKAMQTVRK